MNLEKVIEDLNPIIRGFANYFRIANCKHVFRSLAQWIRHRLKAKQMSLWKNVSKLHRVLRQRGYREDFKAIKMASWRNATSPLASYAMPNSYCEKMGLFSLEVVETGISVPVK